MRSIKSDHSNPSFDAASGSSDSERVNPIPAPSLCIREMTLTPGVCGLGPCRPVQRHPARPRTLHSKMTFRTPGLWRDPERAAANTTATQVYRFTDRQFPGPVPRPARISPPTHPLPDSPRVSHRCPRMARGRYPEPESTHGVGNGGQGRTPDTGRPRSTQGLRNGGRRWTGSPGDVHHVRAGTSTRLAHLVRGARDGLGRLVCVCAVVDRRRNQRRIPVDVNVR